MALRTLPSLLLMWLLPSCAELKTHAVATGPLHQKPSGDEIDDGIRAAQDEIRGCARGGGPSGRSRAKVTLAPGGAVVGVDIGEGPLLGSASGACVAGVLRDIRVLRWRGENFTFETDVNVEPAPREPADSNAPVVPTPRSQHGLLPPAEIQRVVREHFEPLRGCYEQGLMRDPRLEGRVSIRFVIGRDGRVMEVRNVDPSLRDVRVRACLVREFRGLVFPKPEGRIVTVTYPIIFSPGEGVKP